MHGCLIKKGLKFGIQDARANTGRQQDIFFDRLGSSWHRKVSIELFLELVNPGLETAIDPGSNKHIPQIMLVICFTVFEPEVGSKLFQPLAKHARGPAKACVGRVTQSEYGKSQIGQNVVR